MNIIDTIIVLTQKELKVRYKHHILGYFWSISNPLTYALIYYITFKLIMKVKVDQFPIYLITGLFPWQWIANSAGVGPMTFIGNASLIKKVNFPRYLISLVVVFQDMIHFLISIPIIVIMLYIYNKSPHWTWLIGIPLMCAIQVAYTYALNLILATTNLFFRDIEKLTQMLMTFIFFFTPIVYKPEMVPEKYQIFLYLNPAASLIISWREVLLNGKLDFFNISIATAWALVFALLAQLAYKKLSWRFAEVL